MSAVMRATLLFAALALVVNALAAYLHVPWCGLLLAVLIGLAAGYVAASWQKDDPAKTARIARGGAKVGLVAGIAGAVGGLLVAYMAAPADFVFSACLLLVTAAMTMVFGWLGGWSWARHEHERQTGYKPT